MSIPYKCPVCEGKGSVRAGFYSLCNSTYLSIFGEELCKTCNGSGIVWGKIKASCSSNNLSSGTNHLIIDNKRENLKNYLNKALKNDKFLSALKVVVELKGFSKVAEELKISRTSLYKTLNGSTNPKFETILKILNMFDLRFHVIEINNTKTCLKDENN
jgi:probable addiction module antidote protein